jgi:hypothetical protein
MMSNSEFSFDRSDEFKRLLSETETLINSEANLNEVFQIIDNLIPLECCVYYQVIPLSSRENLLTLGMVNIKNSTAINYIRSIVNSLHFDLQVRPIDLPTHETLLSEYLRYRQAKETESKILAANNFPPANELGLPQFHDKETQHQAEKATFIIDPSHSVAKDLPPASSPIVAQPQSEPEVKIQLLEVSPATSPTQLCKQLLARTLQGDIGRLYFERHPRYGKILCSQEGKIQYSIEKLSIELFQGVIDELKSLVNLPHKHNETIQKIEVEKTYKQEQILLRFQVITTLHGEEGTLQVLKGKAFNFYKQKKLEQMNKQALELAQKLEKKLQQIRAYNTDTNSSLDSLDALQAITQEISKQLE